MCSSDLVDFCVLSSAGGGSVSKYIYTQKTPVLKIANLDIETTRKDGSIANKSKNDMVFKPGSVESDIPVWSITSMPIQQGETSKTIETPDGSALYWGTNNYYYFGADSNINTININSPMYVDSATSTTIAKMENVTTININVPRSEITGSYSELFKGRTVNYNAD